MSETPTAVALHGSTALGNTLLWLSGPCLFAVAGFTCWYCEDCFHLRLLIVCMLAGQLMFVSAWALLAVAEPLFRRDLRFRLLVLHVYVAILLAIPVAADGSSGLARGAFSALLLAHWVLTAVLGGMCFAQWLHPRRAAARTGAS